jgi:hypothetical protein
VVLEHAQATKDHNGIVLALELVHTVVTAIQAVHQLVLTNVLLVSKDVVVLLDTNLVATMTQTHA